MDRKPKHASGYQPESVLRVRQTLLFIASKLGDLMENIVVVGGLVPYLLIEQEGLPAPRRHVGTLDLDLGLSLAILDDERYREVADRLRAEGFKAVEKIEGRIRRQTWALGSGTEEVSVDFLIQPNTQQPEPGKMTNIEHDLAAVTVEGLDLAFMAHRRVQISGTLPNGSTLTREVKVAGPAAFIVLKAIAFHLRGENKDAYDLFYILREMPRGEAKADFERLPGDHPAVMQALRHLRQDFIEDNAGLAQAAEFILGRRDQVVEADVAVAVRAFLRSAEGTE
jgi:hypothetical protein